MLLLGQKKGASHIFKGKGVKIMKRLMTLILVCSFLGTGLLFAADEPAAAPVAPAVTTAPAAAVASTPTKPMKKKHKKMIKKENKMENKQEAAPVK
jgi:hypothetical protein